MLYAEEDSLAIAPALTLLNARIEWEIWKSRCYASRLVDLCILLASHGCGSNKNVSRYR